MGFLKAVKDFFKFTGEQTGLPARHLEGLEGVLYNTRVGLLTDTENRHVALTIHHPLKKGDEVRILPFDQIAGVDFVTWEKTFRRARSPFSEGLAGGVIGGDTMAVISAMDAVGRTRIEDVKVDFAVQIRYHPKGDLRTVRRIVVGDVVKSTAKNWADTLCWHAGLTRARFIEPERTPRGPTYL
ncbi:hypothetical protein D7V91_00495 [bacterium 1xD42-67]|nr:hypothetical protein D7V91_00495 [bacterium 1xD42-67]